MGTFLPTNYEPPVRGNYAKLAIGKNKFRILAAPILGFMYWTVTAEGRKPVRKRMNEKIDHSQLGVNDRGEQEKVKHFWAMPVWSYTAAAIQILEITQSSIQDSIRALDTDDEWGDPCQYDISITKKGTGLDTEYAVLASPKSPLDPNIAAAFHIANLNLDALFSGGDPFAAPVQATAPTRPTTAPRPGSPPPRPTTAPAMAPLTSSGDECWDAFGLSRGASQLTYEDQSVQWKRLLESYIAQIQKPEANFTGEDWGAFLSLCKAFIAPF